MSRGNIILSKVKTLVSSNKESSFKFQTTHSMSPSARLVAYIIQKNGEVVVDSLNLKIEKPFENTVRLFTWLFKVYFKVVNLSGNTSLTI